jgi:acyl-CoA synthetase (AMP-forming)/AMP-acid ligase II/fatty-acid desaturase
VLSSNPKNIFVAWIESESGSGLAPQSFQKSTAVFVLEIVLFSKLPSTIERLLTSKQHRRLIKIMAPSFTTLPQLLERRAHERPELLLYRFLIDGESKSESLTASELLDASMAVAEQLRDRCGNDDRVLLLAPPGIDFLRGFFGIQWAGLIATATFPPHPRRVDKTLPRLEGIIRSCRPRVVLTTSSLAEVADKLSIPAIILDDVARQPTQLVKAPTTLNSMPAFLQYTSGSTGEPRGVILSHRNLLDNLRFIAERFQHTPESKGVIWLPPYHDMGLIGGILEPLHTGFPVVLMNPLHVLQRPLRWLQAITENRATTSGGPNFIYEHCIDSIPEIDLEKLDLRSWQVAFCGAESVRPTTWRRFAEKFEVSGFQKRSFFPCYGLAEATLMVTGSPTDREPTTAIVEMPTSGSRHQHIEYTGCGFPDLDHRLRIVDPITEKEVQQGAEGEIIVSGPSVAEGYWSDIEATESTFLVDSGTGDRQLKTGDLGFIRGGELFVTGRLKDLVVIAGRNLHPHDMEAAIEKSHPLFHSNGACVFSTESESREQLIVMLEIRPGIRKLTSDQRKECAAAVRRVLSEEFDANFHELWLVKAGSLSKTTSGKKRRQQTKALYQAKHFQHEDICLGDFGVGAGMRGVHASSEKAERLQRRLALVMVVVPMIGLAAAIAISWNSGIYPIDFFWLVSMYIATVLGVEVGMHRHFSHRAFQATPAVRSMLCILGSMAAQGPVLFWVTTHRRHHAFSDQADDPHSPMPVSPGFFGALKGLWHAHVGWLFKTEVTDPMQYGKDVFRDPLVFRLSRYYPIWVLLGLAIPAVSNWMITGTVIGMLRGFLWGGLVRILCVHHATWSVNSICHFYGRRAYETRDESRNNGWLMPTSLGGSWHNNHHAFPNSAYTGIRSWELDPSGWLVRLLKWSELAWDVKTPYRRELFDKRLEVLGESRSNPRSSESIVSAPIFTPSSPMDEAVS